MKLISNARELKEIQKKKIEQGKTLATLSQKASVKHFIYTSVGGSNRSTGIPHFDSKFQIEEHIRSLNIPYTILRPVFFMDNLKWPGMMGQITAAFFKYQLREGRKLQMIAVRDIGEFARIALEVGESCSFHWSKLSKG